MKESIRAIIICAGEATRWGDFMGVPKHLVEVEGEKLLYRTVRLLMDNGVDDIYVVSKDDPRYNVPNTKQHIVEPNADNFDADKFLSSKAIWNREGRTLFIMGDCYFTDRCMRDIVNGNTRRKDWLIHCRVGASAITGCKYGEIFSFGIPSDKLDLAEEHLEKLVKLCREGAITKSGGWALYRSLSGADVMDLKKHFMWGNYVVVDDWTDDFDFPKDFQRWIDRRIRKFGQQVVVTNPMINGKRMYNEG